jgi:membrane-bound lytic murein transglycosylase D
MLAEVGKLVTATGKRRVKRRSHSPDNLRSRWLAGLEMPEIPVEDDPRVQKRFEFYTENPLGRETFQQMLFRCGAYKDAIQSSLIRRGIPKDLIAVAYAESGCSPLAKSPVGAEGLWQFIPDAARAYHLRIIEGVVDERHSPQKSTEAAIQYFSDLYAKFGSWDLVFSAYNMGPFGLATRLERVEGDDVGFWELVDAELLPDETADYAPAIQAIALILNNLQRLKFGGIQQRAPQMTMDLQVPPNTRLSLVARAAALSVDELRRLNLDIEGLVTPNVPNFAVQVPKDSVWQARDTLQDLLKSKDESDLCAPANFDWGRQRFTPEMQEACARNLAARGPAPAGSAAP